MQLGISKRLVVDASVAGAAGGEEAEASVSINCTEVLEIFRDKCLHHVVMTPELYEEWDEHQSIFAATWLASMIATGRSCDVESSENQALCTKIEKAAEQKNQIPVMRKDFHLLEGARISDQTIISLEKRVRRHFAHAAQHVDEIRDIVWVNPNCTAEEEPIEWLKNGAPPEEHRKLRTWVDINPEQ